MTKTDDERKQDDKEDRISRLAKSDMVRQIPYDIEVSRYTGPKKPTPPETSMIVKVPTLATLARTASVLNRARERDIEVFKNVYIGGPEHSGFNTKKIKAREEGHSLKPKTKVIYLPLIDMPPVVERHTLK